ncbi:hypothetical protein [uncultured Corynebacterium sp.]|uniref:hypothetical protein n=1 Tax=uncultured Corynebacterium sp. TaxID=159447 RepID=UPI0028D21FCB|nr:hypothetical protein [uncultured Corynebacterium sp.]
MCPVARLVKRGCLSVLALVVCLIVMVVSAEKYASTRRTLPENTASWGQSGNYIMGYGPVREPYSSSIKNTYQVFSPDGQWLDETTQKGGYYPIAIPTRQGSYLYFADAIKQAGEHTHEVDIMDYDPIEYSSNSETGTFGVAVVNASTSEFSYDIVGLTADGRSTKFSTVMVPHSLAVGKDYALVAGHASSAKKLLLVNNQGQAKEINFPKGYQLDSPNFPYPYVNYLGNDRFEVLQAERVKELERGHTVDFVSFEIELGEHHADPDHALSVSRFTKTLPDDFGAGYALSHGDTGYTTKDGRIYVNKRLTKNEPTFTGQLAGFSKDRLLTNNIFIPVNSLFGDPLFGIKDKESISIRSWFEPNKVRTVIPVSKNACFFDMDDVCGLASINLVP